jgi:hypothetical protein
MLEFVNDEYLMKLTKFALPFNFTATLRRINAARYALISYLQAWPFQLWDCDGRPSVPISSIMTSARQPCLRQY